MNLTRWFRRHRRYLLAGLVVMLMVAWGVLGTVQGLLRGSQPAWGTIRGEGVTDADVREAHASLRLALALGLLDPKAFGVLRLANPTPRAMAMLFALNRDLADFVFAQGRSLNSPAAWRMLVLMREAEAVGIQVTQAEAGELLTLSPSLLELRGFSRERYRSFLTVYGYTEGEVTRGVVNLARIAKLILLHRDAVAVSLPELWMTYAHDSRKLKVRFVEVDSEWFEPGVEVDAEELQRFYDEHSDQLPDPTTGKIGYMAPDRVKVEYTLVPLDELAGQAEVTDDQVGAYYEEHRREFMEPVAETAGEEDEAEPAEDEGEGQADKAPEGYRYLTLEEAADKVREKLARQEARHEGEELVAKVLEELDAVSASYANQPLPLGQMARRHGLSYQVAQVPGGRELLSRTELTEAVPYGAEVAAFAFDEGAITFYPRAFTSGEDLVICQVLERAAAAPRPFEEVRDEVRRDCVTRAALERAETFAGKLKERIEETGLAEAAAEMEGRLRNLLGPGAPSAGAQRDAEPEGLLTVRESEFFTRGRRVIPGMGGAGTAVAEAAFGLTADEVAVAVEGPPVAACYVIQVCGRQDASREEFARRGAFYRMLYLPGKQSQDVQGWLGGLLDAAQPTKSLTE
ncbi:MAG: hypothetical protein AMK73_06945 [Planctomycetes bacterium SM23_32]|nr:MAG: hypothetical protein AMK73_06945 [Planctomycetes bacterium SM23_32]